MLNFKDCYALLSGALCAMGNLAIHQPNSDELVHLGGLEVILDAMKRYVNTFSVIDYGSFVLCNVADDAKYKDRVRKEKGLEFALENIKKENTPKEHLAPFLDLIAVLTQDSEERKLIGKDILTDICTIIRKYKSDTQLLTHCLTVVMVLCENSEENRSHGISLDMITLLFSILSEHQKAAVVVMKAALALFTLFWRHPSPEMDVNRKKLIDVIIDALKSHPNEISLQRTSAAMLSDFAHDDDELKKYIANMGGVALVRRAAMIGSDDIDLDEGWDLLVEYITLDY